MWIQNKSSYLTVKQQAKSWKKLDKVSRQSFKNLEDYLTLKRAKQDISLLQVYIPKTHTYPYSAPFYIKKTGYKLIMQYKQDGSIKSRKTLPQNLRLISISKNWFTSKFGEPV